MVLIKQANSMDYYCEVCNIFIKPKSKQKRFKSNTHKEVDICKYIKLTTENPDIKNIDKAFYAYIIQHKKKLTITSLNVNLNSFLMTISIVYILRLIYVIIKRCVLGKIFFSKIDS